MRIAQLLVLAAKRSDFKRIHQAADEFLEPFKRMMLRAFKRSRLSKAALREALRDKDERRILSLVSASIEKMQAELEEDMPELLLDVMNASATAMEGRLRVSALLRAAYDPDQPRDKDGQWSDGSGGGGKKQGRTVKPIIKAEGDAVEADVPLDLIEDAKQIAEILSRFDDSSALAFIDTDGERTRVSVVVNDEHGNLVRQVAFAIDEGESDMYWDIVGFDKQTSPREARETMRTVIDAADDADVDTISLDASLEDGGYLWARMGFEADAPKEFTRMVKKRLERVKDLHQRARLAEFIEDHADTNDLPGKLAEMAGSDELLRGSRWKGIIERKKPGAMDKINRFVGRKKPGANLPKAAATDNRPLIERLFLTPMGELRAAAPKIKDFKFDVTNERAQEWAREHAAETIQGISKTTRDEIRNLVEGAFEEQYDVDELADKIEELIGDEARAETIARTETMRASNEGQLELWEQAREDGFLTGNEQKEWITTPDDRLCPVCEPMDGETVDMDDKFDVDGEMLDGPPAHPNCRCTIALSVRT